MVGYVFIDVCINLVLLIGWSFCWIFWVNVCVKVVVRILRGWFLVWVWFVLRVNVVVREYGLGWMRVLWIVLVNIFVRLL